MHNRNGVYTDKSCDNLHLNHGVVVVSWGALNGVNHWIVRNSWGANWGNKGYILIKCNIESSPAFVTVAIAHIKPSIYCIVVIESLRRGTKLL